MEPLRIGTTDIAPGERRQVELPVARLPTGTWLSLPVEVVRGRRPGPRLWLSAAVHGDEINGVEIIRRVMRRIDAETLRGAVLAAPIVNVFGFIHQSRYLPDRRDLNRSFPGSATGSLAARLAHLFMSEIVCRCTHGIDLHTGSHHRDNLSQIRANLDDEETRRCAEAFGAPIVIHSATRDGSLREAAGARGIAALLYEGGEPLRFSQPAIECGTDGILRVMGSLKMIRRAPRRRAPPAATRRTTWVRARRGGVLHLEVDLGQIVRRDQRLAVITDAMGDESLRVISPIDAMVIGLLRNPLVSRGYSIVHLAELPAGLPGDLDPAVAPRAAARRVVTDEDEKRAERREPRG